LPPDSLRVLDSPDRRLCGPLANRMLRGRHMRIDFWMLTRRDNSDTRDRTC
jgi:hypothetical protein